MFIRAYMRFAAKEKTEIDTCEIRSPAARAHLSALLGVTLVGTHFDVGCLLFRFAVNCKLLARNVIFAIRCPTGSGRDRAGNALAGGVGAGRLVLNRTLSVGR